MEAALMKLLGVISTTGLFLLLGITAPADAQQEQQEKQEQPAKPPKQEQQAKPERRQEQAKGQQDQQREQRQQQDKSAKQEQQQQAKGQQEQQRQQHQQQDKSAKQEQQQQARGQEEQQRQQRQEQADRPSQEEHHGQESEQRVTWQQDRAHNWRSEHRTWQQRGGYDGYRIPDDRFRGYFGREHGFRVYSLPVVVVGGYPRFQYGGYWFSLVDPWPEYWSDDWYDNDDVYVDYSDEGYYLYNRRHPGDRIAISVYVN
jgi:hypothetical protein